MEAKGIHKVRATLAIRQTKAEFVITPGKKVPVSISIECKRNGIPKNSIIHTSLSMNTGANFVTIDLNDFGLGNIQNGDKFTVTVGTGLSQEKFVFVAPVTT